MDGILPSANSYQFNESDVIPVWDLSPVPTFILSPSHRIERVSVGALDTWNCMPEQLVGKDVFDALYGGSPLERFDRIPLAHAIGVATVTRKPIICLGAYREQSDSWCARIIPIFRGADLLMLVAEWDQGDSSAKALGGKSTQGMQSIDEMFRLLVHTVKDYAIFLLDTRGYVTTWNTGAKMLKGYESGDIIGRHFSNFYGEEDLSSGKPEHELITCLEHGRVEDEGWRYRKDGSRFWANVVITAIYRNGVHVGFGKVTRDLTERREGELRLVAAYEESSRLKNDFLANISHEIRTPMHGLLSASELLLDTTLTEDQRETANIVAESGQYLLAVINGILDYSKLTSGAFPITSEVFDVRRVVSSVTRSMQMTLMPGVQMRLDVPNDVPELARGDQLRFRQILQNIADNAAKFTEKGYVSIKLSVLDEDDTTFRIATEVADTGIGIDGASEQKLFKPFMQLEKSISKSFQGTGLGLSIAKSLAELLGGQMGYRPNPDCQGSVFWFSARFEKVSHQESQKPFDKRSPAHTQTEGSGIGKACSITAQKRLRDLGSTKRLLAVEDNIINQKVLVGMLHAFGIKNVAVAPDGEQAVSILSNSPSKFDLILMDVSMPVMDGFEATTRIRKSGSNTPIIAMTANALRGYREKCLESGMDDYIPKPVGKNVLLQKLLRWLDRPEGGEA